jgi:hypothetical protein
MHWLLDHDPEAWALLMRTEERLADVRAFTGRRALRRDSHAPRRRVRVWLGSVLLAVGHRLVQTSPPACTPGVE